MQNFCKLRESSEDPGTSLTRRMSWVDRRRPLLKFLQMLLFVGVRKGAEYLCGPLAATETYSVLSLRLLTLAGPFMLVSVHSLT